MVTNDVTAVTVTVECQPGPVCSRAGGAAPAKAVSALALAYTPIYVQPFGLRLIF